jgi:hypothetical protein
MNFPQLLTTAAKRLGTSGPRHTVSYDARGEFVRHDATGDPRLDLALAERSFR